MSPKYTQQCPKNVAKTYPERAQNIPRITLKSSWVYRTFDKKWNEQDSLFQSIEKDGFDTRTTGSFSINANTKIYGAFPIPIGPLKVIRHVASPSIGYSWTPDFSKPLFDNFNKVLAQYKRSFPIN